MAHLLTGIRLLLALPLAVAFARPDVLGAGLVALLLGVAIATDYVDGIVARRQDTASPGGQLFDHGTDCLFVTTGLTGTAAHHLLHHAHHHLHHFEHLSARSTRSAGAAKLSRATKLTCST